MFKKIKLITGALVVYFALIQMTGCLIPKEENRFTGKWIIYNAGQPNERKSCEEGGHECVAAKISFEANTTSDSDIDNFFK